MAKLTNVSLLHKRYSLAEWSGKTLQQGEIGIDLTNQVVYVALANNASINPVSNVLALAKAAAEGNYVTTVDLNTALEDYYTKDEIDAIIAGLDATVDNGDNDLVKVTITEVDGVLTNVVVDDSKLDTKFESYKTKQNAVQDPGSVGKALDFIVSIEQNENGVITATKSKVDLDAYETKAQAEGKYAEIAYESKVDTLIGAVEGDDTKSVRAIAADEIAKQLIAEDAQEALDTLEEIAAWIQSHPDDAAAMNEAIDALEKDIADNRGKWEKDTTYSADDETLTKSDENVFSVKDGGINTDQIANQAVTVDKLDGTVVTNITNGAEAHTTLTNGTVSVSANAADQIIVSAFGKDSNAFTVPFATNATNAGQATYATNAGQLGEHGPEYYATADALAGVKSTAEGKQDPISGASGQITVTNNVIGLAEVSKEDVSSASVQNMFGAVSIDKYGRVVSYIAIDTFDGNA